MTLAYFPRSRDRAAFTAFFTPVSLWADAHRDTLFSTAAFDGLCPLSLIALIADLWSNTGNDPVFSGDFFVAPLFFRAVADTPPPLVRIPRPPFFFAIFLLSLPFSPPRSGG